MNRMRVRIRWIRERIQLIVTRIRRMRARIQLIRDRIRWMRARVQLIRDRIRWMHACIQLIRDRIRWMHARMQLIRDRIQRMRVPIGCAHAFVAFFCRRNFWISFGFRIQRAQLWESHRLARVPPRGSQAAFGLGGDYSARVRYPVADRRKT
jgi:hypothetical protein